MVVAMKMDVCTEMNIVSLIIIVVEIKLIIYKKSSSSDYYEICFIRR